MKQTSKQTKVRPVAHHGSAHVLLAIHLRALNLPLPTHEFRFEPARRWRWDLCWPNLRLAVEIHGGVYSRGRHTRGGGFTKDREKINAGVELGWRVLEYTTEQIESGAAVRQIARVLGALGVTKIERASA